MNSSEENKQIISSQSNHGSTYKDKVPFERRVKDADKARKQFPTKLPLIIERAPDQKNLQELSNPKFMMPQSFKIGEVITVIRKNLKIGKD
mmetsp:Transcript_37748/g.36204  ORF Transcript_37748/g.36204 Transcript_37748/m.36204 type:complete len:91 (-) Transcript_37748:198-470(-)